MATTGTRKRIDLCGHRVDLVFIWFDSSRSVENPEVDGVASRRKTDAGEVRRGQDLGAVDGELHYHSYVPDGNSRADYGWMVSIDGVQRTGVFAREEDALEMATELIGDIEDAMPLASTIEKREINGRLEDVVVVRKLGEVILVPFSTALLADYGEGQVIAMCEDLASRGVVQ